MASSALEHHILMLPYPLQGHITPLMQLSKLLAARGFRITFVMNEFIVRRMLAAKQDPSVGDITQLGIQLLGVPDAPASDFHDCLSRLESFVAAIDALHRGFEEAVRSMVRDQQMQISCIISDSFLVWSQDVANKWGIARVSFWPQSLATFACSFSLSKIMAEHPDLDPFSKEIFRTEHSRQLMNCVPGIPSIDARRLPFFGLPKGVEWYREIVLTQMERASESLCIICNSFPELEKEVHTQLKEPLLPKPFFALGPLLPSSFLGGQKGPANDEGTGCSLADEHEECLQWLDSQHQDSVLYISVGSFLHIEEQDALEIAAALNSCKVSYLWVIRNMTPELNRATQAAHGKVVEWAPQLKVLAHKAVGGFFTHCGWNSTMETISLGVPVIAWPQMIDQNTHCWFLVEKLNMGLRVEVDASNKVKADGVEKAVRALMQDPEGHRLRVRANELSSLAKLATATTCVSNMDSFVHAVSLSKRISRSL